MPVSSSFSEFYGPPPRPEGETLRPGIGLQPAQLAQDLLEFSPWKWDQKMWLLLVKNPPELTLELLAAVVVLLDHGELEVELLQAGEDAGEVAEDVVGGVEAQGVEEGDGHDGEDGGGGGGARDGWHQGLELNILIILEPRPVASGLPPPPLLHGRHPLHGAVGPLNPGAVPGAVGLVAGAVVTRVPGKEETDKLMPQIKETNPCHKLMSQIHATQTTNYISSDLAFVDSLGPRFHRADEEHHGLEVADELDVGVLVEVEEGVDGPGVVVALLHATNHADYLGHSCKLVARRSADEPTSKPTWQCFTPRS